MRKALPPLAALGLLAACVSTPREAPVVVRHFGSTQFHAGAQLRLFTFDPREPRPLDARIRLAKAEIARDPDCTWGNAPRAVIEEATRRQGAAWADTLLAAPVTCTT